MKTGFGWVASVVAVGVVLALPASAQEPSAAERVASLKAILAASQVVLRQYEWVETSVVSVKGDEKSKMLQRCYYGADGKLQKVPLAATAPEPAKRGVRGRIAEKKKEELTGTMRDAVDLVRQYVPPDQERLQAAKDAGKVALQLLEPGKRIRLTFSDYLKAGDSFALDVDLTTNRPLAATVKSYLDTAKEPVGLTMTFGTLDDGTTYASGAVLDAKGAGLAVTLQNAGYRKAVQ
jgi:hypothetical protein